jgi:hypothetical protein
MKTKKKIKGTKKKKTAKTAPLSERYCLICDTYRTYTYNPKIRHSQCSVCGNGYGINCNNPVLEHFEEKIAALKRYYEPGVQERDIAKLRAKVHQLRNDNRRLQVEMERLKKKIEVIP